jgi:holo-[acyl-carrier protein] synthase
VRVGVDLASIAAVRASIERFGDRYTHRCFTDREVEACSGSPEVRAASLAARFAAKEATVKALRAGPYGFDWRSVEILRQPDGGCAIALHGSLAELAARDGVGELSVSLTHEGAVAAAVVVALCEPTGHEMFDVAASARRDTAKES